MQQLDRRIALLPTPNQERLPPGFARRLLCFSRCRRPGERVGDEAQVREQAVLATDPMAGKRTATCKRLLIAIEICLARVSSEGRGICRRLVPRRGGNDALSESGRRDPRPAAWQATGAAVRGKHRRFQRRLLRDYARSVDGHPCGETCIRRLRGRSVSGRSSHARLRSGASVPAEIQRLRSARGRRLGTLSAVGRARARRRSPRTLSLPAIRSRSALAVPPTSRRNATGSSSSVNAAYVRRVSVSCPGRR